MSEKTEEAVVGFLASSEIVSDISLSSRGDFKFAINGNSDKYQVSAISVVGSYVFLAHMDISISEDKESQDAVHKFISECNSQLPFGEFLVDPALQVVFKIYLLNASASDREDVLFSIFWIQDILNSYKDGFHAVVGGFIEPKSAADKIQMELARRKTELEK